MLKGRLNCVYGGCVGSEAKGKMGAWLAERYKVDVFAGSLSPNAGHTVIYGDRKFVTHHIPVSVVGRWIEGGAEAMKKVRVYMGPCTIINPDTFKDDLTLLYLLGVKEENVVIDARAGVITPIHIAQESKGMTHIGSTAQGVGLARVDKLMRRGNLVGNLNMRIPCRVEENVSFLLWKELEKEEAVIYEMGQGFDLCLEHGIDPTYCTSRIVSPQMALAEMGLPAKYLGHRYSVIRTFPIRVNNRTGSSGPYPSREMSWEEIGNKCGAPGDITEYTTTTKLMRRVFGLSALRVREMVRVTDPTYLCLQFANYVDWKAYGKTTYGEMPPRVKEFVSVTEEVAQTRIRYVGTGPDHSHMVDRGKGR